ncbi:hypothetical protein N7532_003015 [Penicillium argentinense]|uniref:GPI anchored protein n=1 Tax=Penicillium argentinense TaxID=1131581 RepID=A0A9W9FLP3_9EURO|nr:uncharacterized protein N7532_003015 [Penicillium argentinense]KAJ5102486.1 hypothetical protein N7532_003015 [Penicillium argentinense]
MRPSRPDGVPTQSPSGSCDNSPFKFELPGKALLTLGTAALAAAESSVVSLFIPDVEGTALVASVVAQSAGMTTYSINCPSGTDSSDCGVAPGLTLTSGSKTVEWSMSEPGEFFGRIVCEMGGTTTATCTETDSGSGANFPGTHTMTFASSDISSLPVTITAGAAAGATTGASVATTEASVTSDRTSQTSTNTEATTGPSDSANDGMSSATSTGGIARITGTPALALGGAAIALVAVAL